MAPIIQKVYLDHPPKRILEQAVTILKKGGVIVYPTDTIYGLGADLYNKKAMERIIRIKGSPSKKLLSFILPDLKQIADYAIVPDFAFKIIRRVTPGRYTFVLNATREVPKILLEKRKTVGIRIPDSPLANQLVELLGHPILSTSVPTDEQEGFHTDPLEIADRFNHEIDMILDAGVLFNQPSTVVDFTDDKPLILRAGSGNIDALNY